MKINPAHILFEKHLKELGLDFIAEHRFHEQRKWRLDYTIVETLGKGELTSNLGIAIEIEGAIWSRGRHTRGKGFQADLDKYNHATMMGYRVLRFSTDDIMRGRAKAFLAEHLKAEGQ
jgi:hypothetical protein